MFLVILEEFCRDSSGILLVVSKINKNTRVKLKKKKEKNTIKLFHPRNPNVCSVFFLNKTSQTNF